MTNNGTKNPLLTPTPNERYQPWGKSVQMAAKISPDTSVYNLALKDPLVWSSDHWNFPTNTFSTVGWLGRVHRGTPWQTVYLKATDLLDQIQVNTSTTPPTTNYIGKNIWMNWTGNFNPNDTVNTGPAQDRMLFDVFSTSINDNATRGRLSVNVAANPNDPAAGLAAWSALFGGVTMLSNNLPNDVAGSKTATTLNTFHTKNPLLTVPSYTNFPVNPAGLDGMSSPLGQLVTSINSTRTNTGLFPKPAFGSKYGVGDILAVPALTEQSPLLNWNNASQQHYGISDEMYEWLPQQAMSLLRADGNPRYVIYCYGQTLKPAPNGVVTGGLNLANGVSPFGMVTNYQVVAETATRAVVQFRPVVVTNYAVIPPQVQTNYSATIEQFNPLPPD
jgi:hypothetical protein